MQLEKLNDGKRHLFNCLDSYIDINEGGSESRAEDESCFGLLRKCSPQGGERTRKTKNIEHHQETSRNKIN